MRKPSVQSPADGLAVLKSAVPSDGFWLVGGCLRDALLKRPLRDVDLAVQGDPAKAARGLADRLKCAVFPLDKKRGIHRVTHGRDGAVVTFDFCKLQGKDIGQDLARRDFTVNALALPLGAWGAAGWEKALLDPFDGRGDLRARSVRLVGEKALKDDPLRLLRAFRMAAELDFSIDRKTAAALRRHAALIRKSAPERIREELFKILSTPRAAATFRSMDGAGLLSALIPEVEPMRKAAHVYYGKEGVLGHSLSAMAALDGLLGELPSFFPEFHARLKAHLEEPVAGFPRFALLKMGELLHDAGKPVTAGTDDKGKLHFYGHEHAGADLAEKIARRLRFSNDETRSLGRLVRGHMRPGNLGHQPSLTDRAIYRFYRDLESDAVGMLVLSLADHFTYLSEKERAGRRDPVYLAIKKMLRNHFLRPATVQPPKIVDGKVLMAKLRLPEGKRIGRLLEAIREAQAAGKVKTREQALLHAAALLKTKDFQALETPPRAAPKAPPEQL